MEWLLWVLFSCLFLLIAGVLLALWCVQAKNIPEDDEDEEQEDLEEETVIKNRYMMWTPELLRVEDEEIARMQDDICRLKAEINAHKVRESELKELQERLRGSEGDSEARANALEEECSALDQAIERERNAMANLEKQESNLARLSKQREEAYGPGGIVKVSRDRVEEETRSARYRGKLGDLKLFWKNRLDEDKKFEEERRGRKEADDETDAAEDERRRNIQSEIERLKEEQAEAYNRLQKARTLDETQEALHANLNAAQKRMKLEQTL